MRTAHPRSARQGWRFAVAAALGASALVAGTGAATAMVVPVASMTPLFGTDCVYRLDVAVPGSAPVTFIESDADGARPVTAGAVVPRDGVASVRWTPSVRGDRVLVAAQGAARSVPVPVAVRDGGGAMCRSALG